PTLQRIGSVDDVADSRPRTFYEQQRSNQSLFFLEERDVWEQAMVASKIVTHIMSCGHQILYYIQIRIKIEYPRNRPNSKWEIKLIPM
ncbi:hypothetical protein ACHAXS_003682, partial [Conticribra weissflogii]